MRRPEEVKGGPGHQEQERNDRRLERRFTEDRLQRIVQQGSVACAG